jgi:hypothetical protein
MSSVYDQALEGTDNTAAAMGSFEISNFAFLSKFPSCRNADAIGRMGWKAAKTPSVVKTYGFGKSPVRMETHKRSSSIWEVRIPPICNRESALSSRHPEVVDGAKRALKNRSAKSEMRDMPGTVVR